MPNISLSKKIISLDLQHIGHTNTIYAQQGDIDSRQLTIRLFDNGEAYIIPSNATVSLCGTRADKTIIYRDVDSFDSNEITITFKNEELAVSGVAKYKIEIKTVSNNETEKLLTSAPFKLKIYQNIYDENGKLAAPQYSDLKRELDAIHNQEEALRIAEENREQRSSIAIANTEQATADAISAVNNLQDKIASHHFVLTEDKDTAGGVAGLDTNSKVSNSRLYEASANTKGITQLDDSVTSSSSSRAATSKAVKTAYDKAASANAELHTHNSSSTSHDDIRTLVSDLTTRLNALADSDDTTLDQLSEIVAYIKNNKSLIDNVTTSKVNVSDIINSLTSTAANKPLSAKQGKVLNDLITELTATIENKLDESSLESKVSKDGDEMSGELVLKNGSIVAREAGTSGVYGYVKMIQIKILRQYVNYPVIFEITGRGWTSSNKLYVQFKNDSGSDPQLNSFLIDNTPQYKVAIVKSATSTWDIYMQKSESYGMCAVCRMCNTNYIADAVQITFPDTVVSTLPDGAVEPTIMSWDKAKDTDTVDGKHFSDIQELINNKQNIRNGTAHGDFDWDTLTTSGAYKIQYATMEADNHAPVGEYRFGILYVIDSETDNEKRIMQIYFPHSITKSAMWLRMRNGSSWNNWVAITSTAGTVGNANTLGGMDKNQFVHKANPVFDGNLNCRKNIWFNGENDSKMMIEFLDSSDTYGLGVSIGGGGMTIIGGGEAAYEIVNHYTNDRTVKAGGNENMIVANDGVIDFYTNCQNGFSNAKHITMNTDGTITADGFNGNATSASCVLDGGDKRKTYMKYSANCVDDFTYLAVWNPISGGVELRALAKANLKDKLGLGTITNIATPSSNGLMSASDKKKLDGLSASGGTGRTLVTLPASTEASKVFTLSGQDICKGLKLYFYYHSNSSQGSSSSTLVKTVILTQSALTDNAISVNGKDVTLSSNSYTNIVKGYVDTTTVYTLTCKCADINNAPLYKLGNVSFTFGYGSPTTSWFSIEAVNL